MNVKYLQSFYSGFEITEPVGNNAFSFDHRKNKAIFVAPLISAAPADVKPGDKIVFSEMEDGSEKNRTGLKNFVYFPYQGKDIFIFDNHNHAFFFWLAGFLQNKIQPGLPLVHIDQHTDMREPAKYPNFSLNKNVTLKQAFDYTNQILNVGNFIKPALKLGLFTKVQIIDSSTAFEQNIPERFVLDIDLDIFSDDMRYIPEEEKREKIRKYIQKADFITIATSPFFINQNKAIKILRTLFKK